MRFEDAVQAYLLSAVHEHNSVAANPMLLMLCLYLHNKRHDAAYAIDGNKTKATNFLDICISQAAIYCTSSTPCHAHHLALNERRKKQFMLSSNQNESLLRRQPRAHLHVDSCRARLKQRLEAAQEGVSTEDGSSSVTSGLDEDQALQADIMMRRLVQVSTFITYLLIYLFIYLFIYLII